MQGKTLGLWIGAAFALWTFGAQAVRADDAKPVSIVMSPKAGDSVRYKTTLKISVNGNVSAEDMGRFVYAESVNGSVRVSTTAWAHMQTVNGSIKGRMGNAGWDGSLKIASVNGSVELEMPDDFSANVDFKSVNGGINSDFPISISGLIGRSAHGQIGGGGRDLEIRTVNGSVTLRKSSGI